jgi:hypothetical protein
MRSEGLFRCASLPELRTKGAHKGRRTPLSGVVVASAGAPPRSRARLARDGWLLTTSWDGALRRREPPATIEDWYKQDFRVPLAIPLSMRPELRVWFDRALEGLDEGEGDAERRVISFDVLDTAGDREFRKISLENFELADYAWGCTVLLGRGSSLVRRGPRCLFQGVARQLQSSRHADVGRVMWAEDGSTRRNASWRRRFRASLQRRRWRGKRTGPGICRIYTGVPRSGRGWLSVGTSHRHVNRVYSRSLPEKGTASVFSRARKDA